MINILESLKLDPSSVPEILLSYNLCIEWKTYSAHFDRTPDVKEISFSTILGIQLNLFIGNLDIGKFGYKQEVIKAPAAPMSVIILKASDISNFL